MSAEAADRAKLRSELPFSVLVAGSNFLARNVAPAAIDEHRCSHR